MVRQPDKARLACLQTHAGRAQRGRGWLTALLIALVLALTPPAATAQQSPQEIWENARNGDVQAQLELGYHYLSTDHADHDLASARYWFEQATEKGSAEAAAQLGLLVLDNPQQPEDFELAVTALSIGADAGFPEAQFRLASVLTSGFGLATPDAGRARAYFELAAAQNHAGAQAALGVYYFQGIEVERSVTRAAQLFRAAADQGEAMGQYHMFTLHASGAIENASEDAAREWLILAVEQDLPHAIFALGQLHIQGKLVAKNAERGRELVKQAARAGLADAQFQAGVWEANGEHDPPDEQAAVDWYLQAAENGHPDAQYLLGNHLATGRGIPKDLNQAIFWLEAAARSGHPRARQRIETFLAQEQQTPKE